MMTPENAPRLLQVFRAGQISTSLHNAVTVRQDENPSDAYARLTESRFDQAPVMRSGRVVGWVKTANLKAAPKVKGATKALADSAIVSGDAPMAETLALLGSHGFVFTVEERISGFITPSDLDRHAARSHFYLLISGIEMLLSELVRVSIPEELVVLRISEDTRDRWKEARSRNSETHAVEYLYLKDLAELFHEAHGHVAPWTTTLTRQLTDICLSTTLENEAIATVENEATQTDWMGDLCGGLGSDSAAGGGRCSAASGCTRPGHRTVNRRAGAGVGPATEVRAAGGVDVVHAVRAGGAAAVEGHSGYAGDGDCRAGRLDRVDHLVP
jgi:hypothetical protein